MSPIVYKIVEQDAWTVACATGLFTGSPDDLRDGFIHLSAAHQLAGTVERHFRGREGLLLVAFEPTALGPALKWEPSRGGDLFPHLYAPLPTGAALFARPLELDDNGVPRLPADVSC